MLVLGTALLRKRRMIVAMSLLGALAGIAAGVIPARQYRSWATFLPQGEENGMGGLALAASQFGIRVPSGSAAWSVPIYVQLAHSRALLEPILLDTVTVTEQSNRRVRLVDLLEPKGATEGLRMEFAVRELREHVRGEEDKKQGAVTLSATTEWPSVSYWMATRLLEEVNRFNQETRKTQAKAERVFAEAQVKTAEGQLRQAEDNLQRFLQQNRSIRPGSELEFERDRLQREVMFRQSVYTTVAQGFEEARMREVREIPVTTLLEEPRLAVVPEPRRAALRAIAGGAMGGILGCLVALLANALAMVRHDRSPAAEEFFRTLRETMPRFSRGTR